jgi:CRISPR/Cas system Type II protein with McrA/HNH and RuvC-like nuclease domain
MIAMMGSGCSKLLPSVKQTTESPWQTFEDAKKAFDEIEPQKTTREDLKKLGFDPFQTANVKLITYLELIQRFMPNQSIQMSDLDQGVQACLKARELCQGYEISPQMLNSKRYGNAALDLLNFRRKQMTIGWKFKALIVLNEGLVVHKVWGGEPNVAEYEDKKNPLGPLQNIDNILPPIKIF